MACLLSSGVGLGTEAACAKAKTSSEVRLGTAPALPAGAKLIATDAATRPMHVTLTLKPRNAAQLASYAREVSQPGSALFRRYLTPAQFARRYGAATATVEAVERSLAARGLRPAGLSPNRLSLRIDATAGAVAHAFDLQFASYRLADGRDVTLNTQAPAVDRRIAGSVQGVLGLDGLQHMTGQMVRRSTATATAGSRGAQARGHVATGGPQPCYAASYDATEERAWTPDEIATAYGFSGLYEQGDLGKGVTIGVYELEPDAKADIAAYQKCFGTQTSISYTKVDSGSGPGSGSGEAALDIEQLIGVAPGARLIVYQGPNSNGDSPGSGPYDVLAQMVAQDKVQIISSSWGECEAIEGRTDAQSESTLLEEAALQGQTVISASGDTGAEDCDTGGANADSALAVDDPASQPFVTAVGGTSLTAVGPPPTETVWNQRLSGPGMIGIQPGATGGGLSNLWPMPPYQSSAPATLGVIQPYSLLENCTAAAGYCREVPDVSMEADPASGYVMYFNGKETVSNSISGWQPSGGTSAASPVWSALLALADALPTCRAAPIGFANPSLYALAAASPGAYFYDVTSGNNDFAGTEGGLFPAGVGYDMASGLGTPNATALAGALCGQSVRVTGPTSERGFVGTPVPAGVQFTATPPAGLTEAFTFAARALPGGVAVDPSTGVLSGKPSTAGVFDATVAASASNGSIGTAPLVWTVEGRPTATAGSLQVRSGVPQLALTVAAGKHEPGLRTLTLTLPPGLRFASGLSAIQVHAPSGSNLRFKRVIAGHNQLTITLDDPSTRFRVLIGAATLSATGWLRADARRSNPSAVRVGLSAVDRASGASSWSISLKPRR